MPTVTVNEILTSVRYRWYFSLIDDSGTIYFFNNNTGKSQWERPDKDDEGILKVEKEEESLNDLIYNVRKLVWLLHALLVCTEN